PLARWALLLSRGVSPQSSLSRSRRGPRGESTRRGGRRGRRKATRCLTAAWPRGSFVPAVASSPWWGEDAEQTAGPGRHPPRAAAPSGPIAFPAGGGGAGEGGPAMRRSAGGWRAGLLALLVMTGAGRGAAPPVSPGWAAREWLRVQQIDARADQA